MNHCLLFAGLLVVTGSISAQPDEKIKQTVSLNLFPNPSKNRLTIHVKGFTAGLINIIIAGTDGKIWRNDQRLLVSSEEDVIVFFLLPPGTYQLQAVQNQLAVKKKFIVQ